jgi:Putative 2OG-Fe(II) oxygenase
MDKLEEMVVFPSRIYSIEKPEFLEVVRKVSDQKLSEIRTDQVQMTLMTGNYSDVPEIQEFAYYVSQTAWNILSVQGYAMDGLITFFTEMWTQEHNPFSHMDYHVHGMGAVISVFYFLDVSPNGCGLVVHDPRPTKVITNIPAKPSETATDAWTEIVFHPKPGAMIFMPAWLPHAFTKNLSLEPTRFVHMNLSIAKQKTQVEVV